MKMISSDGMVGQALSAPEGFPGYGGSLLGDINDYFFRDGLRPVHDGVMPPEGTALREQAAPYFRDAPPAFAPRLWRELGRATNIAWTTYVEDANVGVQPIDKMTPEQIQERRRAAITGGRIMGMLAAVDATVGIDGAEARTKDVAAFYRTIQEILTGTKLQAVSELNDRLPTNPQLAAMGLANLLSATLHMADRDYDVHGLIAGDVGKFASAVATQLNARPNYAYPDRLRDGLVVVAGDLGRTMGTIVSHHTDFGEFRAENGGAEALPSAGDALGEIGGYWRQSNGIPSAFQTGRLSYAAAVVLKHGAPTDAAIEEITQIRDDRIADAARRGAEQIEPGQRLRQGRFDMARLLLRVKEGILARRGSRRQIEHAMNGYLSRTAEP